MQFVCVLYICSSEESAKAKTQKELLKTLKELKRHLPADKRNKGNKSTTLNTLKYALRCVKQVEGEQNRPILHLYKASFTWLFKKISLNTLIVFL